MGVQLISAGAQAEAGGQFVDLYTPSATIQGTWVANNDATDYYGEMYNSTEADEDELNYTTYLTAGTYEVKLIYITRNSGGIIKVLLDSDEILSQDSYNAAVQRNQISEDTFTVSASGIKTIKVKVDGKNAGSTAYRCWIQSLTFRRTA